MDLTVCGKSYLNEYIRGTTKVTQTYTTITEKRLELSGHVTRRDEEHKGKSTDDRHSRKKKDRTTKDQVDTKIHVNET